MTDKIILDVCCGPRKMWFEKSEPRTLYVDNRNESYDVSDSGKATGLRRVTIAPDIVADFRNMPFEDETFGLVVFDPPHLTSNRVGKKSFMYANYGALSPGEWQNDLRLGFSECFRVLRRDGILIFKWAETNIRLSEVLKCTSQKPLFGNKMPKASGTHWVVFMKQEASK